MGLLATKAFDLSPMALLLGREQRMTHTLNVEGNERPLAGNDDFQALLARVALEEVQFLIVVHDGSGEFIQAAGSNGALIAEQQVRVDGAPRHYRLTRMSAPDDGHDISAPARGGAGPLAKEVLPVHVVAAAFNRFVAGVGHAGALDCVDITSELGLDGGGNEAANRPEREPSSPSRTRNHTLFAYVDGADLHEVAGLLQERMSHFVAGHDWAFALPALVNRRHSPAPEDGPDDLPLWELGLTIPLPMVGMDATDALLDISAILRFLAEQHVHTGRNFVIGLHDGITGLAEDLCYVSSSYPPLEELRQYLGI